MFIATKNRNKLL